MRIKPDLFCTILLPCPAHIVSVDRIDLVALESSCAAPISYDSPNHEAYLFD